MLICLGDLLLFIDYADHGQGIFADLFGVEQARRFVELRYLKRFDEARRMSRELWAQLDGDPSGHVEQAASGQYAKLFAAMPEPAYLTYGNVDLPGPRAPHLRPGHHVLDGQRATLGDWTFGFVGGGLYSAYRTPNEIDEDAFAAKVAATGEVDVLCSHIPPAVPQLLYDTVARRVERGSEALRLAHRGDPAAVRAVRPRAPAAGPPGPDRPDGMHQRGPLPGHRHPVPPGVVAGLACAGARAWVTGRAARRGRRALSGGRGTLRPWATGRRRASRSPRTGST